MKKVPNVICATSWEKEKRRRSQFTVVFNSAQELKVNFYGILLMEALEEHEPLLWEIIWDLNEVFYRK